jgi:PAS domain S-box-containing protein
MSTKPIGTSPHRDAQQQYEQLVASLDGIVWELDARTFLFTFVSQQAERLLGYPMEQWLAPGFWVDHLHPDDRAWAVEFCQRATRERRNHDFEYRMIAADGRTVWLRDVVSVIVEGDVATKLRGVMVDVTERKRAEEAHQAHVWFLESLDRINRAIQGASDLEQMMGDVLDAVLAIFQCDRAWLLYSCDPEAASWRIPMERTRPEFPGAGVLGLDVPLDPDSARVLQILRASSGPVRFDPDSEHPLAAETAKPFHIQSMMAMAIYPKIDKPYALGLHQCSYPRVWTPEEERLFQEVGRRLADALSSLLMLRSLRESEAKLEEAQRIAHVGYWDLDAETERINWSDETYRIFGMQPQACLMTRAGLLERIHAEDRAQVDLAIAEALRGGPRYDVEYRVERPGGEVRIVHSQGDVTRDETGRPRRMFGAVQDVTERRQVEDRLRASEVRFRLFVDHATDAFFLHDEGGAVLDANRQACESLGYCREELIRMTPYDFDADLDPAVLDGMKARLDAGEVFAFDTHHRRKDGTVFPVEVRVRSFWEEGRRYGVSLARDMSERKRGEAALRDMERQLRTLVENFPDFIARFDREGRRLYVNPSITRAFGLPLEHFVGKSLQELAMPGPPGQNDSLQARIRQAVEQGLPNTVEARWWTTWGERIFEVRHIPERDESGKVVSVLAISRDVTERRRAEESLRHSEEEARNRLAEIEQIYRYAPIGLFAIDREYRFTRMNEFLAEINGFTVEEHIGKALWDVVPKLADDLVEIYRPVFERGEPVLGKEIHGQTPKSPGVDRDWLVSYFPFKSEAGEVIGLIGAVLEVTERKRAEEALRKSEERLRQAVRVSHLGIFDHDHLTETYYWSPEERAIHRWEAERPPILSEFLAMLHPEDRERIAAAVRRAHDPAGDGSFDVEQRIIRPDGEVRWLVTRSQTFFEGEGDARHPVRTVGAVLDVTERKRAEEALRRNESYLAEAQRLGRTGSWAWSVATREFVHWSQQHYRLHGLDPHKGTPSWEAAQQFIHPDDRARCLEGIEKAIQGRTDCELDYRAVLSDGSLKYVHSIAHPVFNASGALVEFVGTEMDVTERKRAEAALRDSEQRYREVFNCSSECIFLLDVTPDDRFQFAAFNPTEEQAVGFTTAEVAGRFIEDVLPAGLVATVLPNYRQCVEAGKLISYEEELDLPTGRKSFHTTLIPVRDESGRIYRIIGVSRDVTATRRAEEALRRSEETLRRAQGIGHIGSWVFEVGDSVFIGSEEGYRICGWGPGPHRPEELLAIVHPDDLPRMQTAWQATLAGAPFEIEHRLVVDGKVRWVNVRAEPETDPEGQVVRITGVTQDVTDRKRGEEALRASLREKEVLLKEVHHRVKNNLQLISSLLALQASQLKDRAAAEAFTESQNRVRAMALVHENLYRSGDLASVRLAGHIESLCAYLFRSYNVDPDRIVMDPGVAEVTLDLDRSIRVGLLVNELVSNALKHAFPAGRSGRVLVQLDMSRAGWYTLVVSDNGVGLPPQLTPGHSDSLGLQLIADLTEQLGGTLTLDREGGTTYSIRFPARCQEDSRS